MKEREKLINVNFNEEIGLHKQSDTNISQKCLDFINILISMGELDFTNDSNIDFYNDLIKIMKFVGKKLNKK